MPRYTTNHLGAYTVKLTNNTLILGNQYEYDANGNITVIKEAYTSGSTISYRPVAEYTYDELNQLKTETRYTFTGASDEPATTTVVTYTIDTAGNISSVATTENGNTTTVSYTYGDDYWSDRLSAITIGDITQNISYTYYDGGNCNPNTWYNGTNYSNLTWVQGRRLSSITKGSSTYSYEYDMSGVRSVKIADGWKHEYVTQNGRVVRDKVTDASTGAFQYVLEFGYDESGRPLTLRWYYNEAETWYNAYYYICNAQGDVVKLVSDSGATIAAYSYDAWGRLLSIQGESNGDAFIAYANPLRYRGYYYDTETGFYYLQYRYYDPIVKRFLNADSYASTGQGFIGYNMFAYCNNCPVIGADPAGHEMYFFNYLDIGGEDSYTDGISKALVYSADCTGGGGICGGYGSNIIEFPTTSIIGRTLVSVAAITGAGAMVGNCLAPAAYPNEDDEEKRQNYSYWEAVREGKQVIVGAPLSFTEASLRVAKGGSIMCKNQLAALAIVKVGQYRNAVGPEISNGEGFYWHYHPTRNHTGTKESIHIWFYGEAITTGFFKLGD